MRQKPIKKSFPVIPVALCVLVAIVALFFYVHDRPQPQQQASKVNADLKPVKASTPVEPVSAEAPVTAPEAVEATAPPAVESDGDTPEWIRDTMAAIEDPNPNKRMRAVRDLRHHASGEAMEFLQAFLLDSTPSVVAIAIESLSYIGRRNPEFQSAAFEMLKAKAADEGFLLRNPALVAAAQVMADDSLLPLIAKCIAQEEAMGANFAIGAMSYLASPACIPYLEEAFGKTGDLEAKRNALRTLAVIGTGEAMAFLEKNLAVSDNPEVLAQVTWALSLDNTAEANELLTQALINKQLPEEAIQAIAISPAAPEVFKAALESAFVLPEERASLIQALGSSGGAISGRIANELARELVAYIGSDPVVTKATLPTLSNLGTTEDLSEEVIPQLASSDTLIQESALKLIVKDLNPTNYKNLTQLWWDDDEGIRRTAFTMSEAFLSESDIDDLKKATEHSDKYIAEHSALMIKYLNNFDAVDEKDGVTY